MYKQDLPHLFRLLLLLLVIVLVIVDVVGVLWYPPADLLALAFSSAFFLRHSDLAGILMLCGWFGIGGLAMRAKEKKDWRWLTSKFAFWRDERELQGRANQGDAEAQYELGLLYNLPFGCGMQDVAQAASWYRKAAEQGHTKAQHSLAHMYDENGNQYHGQSPPANSQPAHYDGGEEVRTSRRNSIVDREAANLAAARAALTGKSVEEIAKAGRQWKLAGEVTQTAVFWEGKMGIRLKRVGRFILVILLLGSAAAGIAFWFYHAHEVKLREAEAATAKEEYAKSVVARVMNTWHADDHWEDSLSSTGDSSRALYTIELEKALIHDHPLIVFGDVEDVSKSGQSENSIISIWTETRTSLSTALRLSLLSPPEITNTILGQKDRASEMFVFAVKINSVEKVTMPSNSSGPDYFLAHGVLYAAKPIDVDEPPAESQPPTQ